MNEVGGILTENAALLQRFHDEGHVALLEVAHAAVDQLGGAAGGALAEVALLDEAHGVAARGGIDGDADAGRPAADHGHVPGFIAGAESSDRRFAIHTVLSAKTLNVVPRGVANTWAAGLLLLAPPPVGDFRHVVAVLANVVLVLDQLVAQRLLEVGRPSAKLRQSVDHVHDQVEAVQVVQDHHVERGCGRALLLVAAHVHVLVVGAAVGENFLFHNKHDGTFEEIGNDTGTAFGQNGESTSSMGPVFADLEGRGILDLWVTDGHYNRLLRNTGKLNFDDIGATNGVSQANAQYVSWGTGIYDFDNDGLLDILIFHGGLIHLIPQEHTLFRGLGHDRFSDVSRDAGPVLSQRTVARGACFADYDNDGKVDAFLVNLGAKGTLLHNVSSNTGHWLAIKLQGTKSNRDGIGARVEVFAGANRWTQERVADSGYMSQNEARLHFGLGAATSVDKVIVHWPSGREQTLERQEVDRVLTVEEPK